MNRKHNPLLALVALLLLVTILALICTGCSADAAPADDTTDRLIAEFAGYTGDGGRMVIITDTETGVQYLLVTNNSPAITVLLPVEVAPNG